jgi:hypothetical protein
VPYLKATPVGIVAALIGAVLTVLVPLCVLLIRFRMTLARNDVGAASFGFVLPPGPLERQFVDVRPTHFVTSATVTTRLSAG